MSQTDTIFLCFSNVRVRTAPRVLATEGPRLATCPLPGVATEAVEFRVTLAEAEVVAAEGEEEEAAAVEVSRMTGPKTQ